MPLGPRCRGSPFGYGLMVDLAVLPVFIILGAALFGWFGFLFHPRESKR